MYNVISLSNVCAKVNITYISRNESAQLGVQRRFQRERKRKKNGLKTCQRVKNHHYAAAERLKIADAIKLRCSDWGEWILSRSETENRAWKKQGSSARALCQECLPDRVVRFEGRDVTQVADQRHRPMERRDKVTSLCDTVKVVRFVVLNRLDSTPTLNTSFRTKSQETTERNDPTCTSVTNKRWHNSCSRWCIYKCEGLSELQSGRIDLMPESLHSFCPSTMICDSSSAENRRRTTASEQLCSFDEWFDKVWFQL